jgi:hypothetical protein
MTVKNAELLKSWLILFALCVVLATVNACQPKPLSKSEYIKQQERINKEPHPRKEGDPESLPSGYIREIHWEQRLIMFESDDGYTRVLGPICHNPEMLPVWVGEHVYQINFRWVPRYTEGDVYKGECYVLDWIGHDSERDLHLQSPTPKDASGVTK